MYGRAIDQRLANRLVAMLAGAVVIVDAGVGNLRSVQKAFEALGARAEITSDPERIRRADRIVVPGQGAFCDGMKGLSQGLGQAIVNAIRRGTPYLGICLGLQMLFESSEEGERCAGLAILPGQVRKFVLSVGFKIPHMGWNEVGLDGASAHYYFAHSYYAEPSRAADVWGTAEHGIRFCAAIRRDNIWAVQFHPEKSQKDGVVLLGRWLCA